MKRDSLVFLGVDDRIRLDGAEYTVVGLEDGQRVWLEGQEKSRLVISLPAAQNVPDFEILSHGSIPRRRESFLETVEPALREPQARLLDRLHEAVTGFRPTLWGADPPVPRDGFDPEKTTPTQRIERAAVELGRSRSWMFEQLRRLFAEGEQGVIPLHKRRSLKGSEQFSEEHREIVDAVMESILGETKPRTLKKSKTTIQEVLRRVNAEIDLHNRERSAEEALARLVPSSFYRKFDLRFYHWGLNRRAWRWVTGKHGRKAMGRFRASRPGQFVLIDISPFDLFALDPISGEPRRYKLVLAVDLYSRSIVAFRLIESDAGGVDAALLLFDIVSTSALLHRPIGGEHDAPWVGVPQHLVLPAIGVPETLVVDRGAPFRALVFFGVCLRLGISILQARPYRGKDKAQIERVFGVLSHHLLVSLPGFTGSGVHERGKAPDKDALLWRDELELILCSYIVEIYQSTPHRGLRYAYGQSQRDRSPNEMLAEGFRRAGLPPIVADPTLIYECMPVYFRVIGDDGIEIRGLHYYDEILDDYIGESSGINPALWRGARGEYAPNLRRGDKRQPWPVRRNRYDLRQVYWQHPETLHWHTLRCTDIPDIYVPFTDLMWDQACRDAGPGLSRTERTEIRREALTSLLSRFMLGAPTTEEERRLFQHEQLLRMRADRDQAIAAALAEHASRLDGIELPDLFETDDISEIEAEDVFVVEYEDDEDD